MTAGPSAEIIGRATVLSCPKCMGALYEVQAGDDWRFRCDAGHSYSLDEICPGIEESLGGLLGHAIGALMK